VEGTPCDDVIVVHDENIDTVSGAGGDDVIIANGEVVEIFGDAGSDHIYGEDVNAPKILKQLDSQGVIETGAPVYRTADVEASLDTSPDRRAMTSTVYYGGIGSQTIVGGGGDDWIYGMRGNDTLGVTRLSLG
jgi:Ca2+-binding RTX toxin-like protein